LSFKEPDKQLDDLNNKLLHYKLQLRPNGGCWVNSMSR